MNIFDMDKLSLPEQVLKNKEDILKIINEIIPSTVATGGNLLINSNFKINQRGAASYSTVDKYTVDRWILRSGSVTVDPDGIILNGTIEQILEITPNGNVVASSNAGAISYNNGVVTITTTESTLIKWAKLEYGDVPTKYIVPEYVDELQKCYRYYQRNATGAGSGFPISAMGFVTSASSIAFSYSIQPMRIKPTITFASLYYRIGSDGVNNPITTLGTPDYFNNSSVIAITVTGLSGLTVGTNACLQIRTSGYIDFDAEIY